MKISIIGTGYVGLVTGACLAETGADVCCIDNNKEKIDKLLKGEMPIYEPGLDAIVLRNIDKKRLQFSTDSTTKIKESDILFIAVGTPSDEDGSADLRFVLSVASEIGRTIETPTLIVTKSTVPVGTAGKVREAVQLELNRRNLDLQFEVASNPEFLKEGTAVDDFMKPDRIVIGVDSQNAEKMLRRLYQPFILNNHPLLCMDITSAEMTKYAANAMLATKISFINDIANLCEMVGADINNVRKGIGSDTRIGHQFLYPGVGYGGSCFPKDVKALIKTGTENQHDLRILQAVEAVNQSQKELIYNKLEGYFNGDLKGKTIAVWGLAFKPGTDDMREAPSIVLISRLLQAGANVLAYDPVAMDMAKELLPSGVVYCEEMYEATVDADALVIITEWNEFRLPNYRILKKLMSHTALFDGRNILNHEEMATEGFNYFPIGRPSVTSVSNEKAVRV